MVSVETGVQWVPAVGQSLAVEVQLPFAASQRQMGRQVCAPLWALHCWPGAQLAALVQVWPSVPVRVVSGQAQST